MHSWVSFLSHLFWRVHSFWTFRIIAPRNQIATSLRIATPPPEPFFKSRVCLLIWVFCVLLFCNAIVIPLSSPPRRTSRTYPTSATPITPATYFDSESTKLPLFSFSTFRFHSLSEKTPLSPPQPPPTHTPFHPCETLRPRNSAEFATTNHRWRWARRNIAVCDIFFCFSYAALREDDGLQGTLQHIPQNTRYNTHTLQHTYCNTDPAKHTLAHTRHHTHAATHALQHTFAKTIGSRARGNTRCKTKDATHIATNAATHIVTNDRNKPCNTHCNNDVTHNATDLCENDRL